MHFLARWDVGIVPGQDFDITKLDSGAAAAIRKVPDLAQAKITSSLGVLSYHARHVPD
jgi:hypothetical protein